MGEHHQEGKALIEKERATRLHLLPPEDEPAYDHSLASDSDPIDKIPFKELTACPANST